MARKELSDALRHEFFRSGSVLRSTFFTILSLLLAVMLLFQIWLYIMPTRGCSAVHARAARPFSPWRQSCPMKISAGSAMRRNS